MRREHAVNAFFILFHALNFMATKKRVPVMVSLGITGRCNLNCPFCYARDSENRPSQEYSTAQILDYVDQFIKLGTRIFLLQGGEPLLRNDLKDIIAYIRKKKRYCRISTNGVLVKDRINSLAGLDMISFSLDGNEEVVTGTRGKGVYRKVVDGMEAAYQKKIPFEIHASLIRESVSNKDSIYHLLSLAKKYHTYVSFCIACVSGAENTKSVGSADLSSDEVKAFYRFLMQLKKEGYPVSNTYNSLKKTLNWPVSYAQIGYEDNLPKGFDFIECRHGKLVCWLDSDNTLYPCPNTFLMPEFAVKVKDGNLSRAWEALGKKITCMACGGSDESTTFLALKFEDLAEAFLRQVGIKK